MKNHFFLLCALCLGSVMALADEVPLRRVRDNYEIKPLKIVFDNDVHGAIDRYEYLAGYRDALRTEYPVLTVSVGDYLQGSSYASVSQGAFCIEMMNAVGYDVLAVGNHDLDYGLPRLLELRDSLNSRTAMVCANLYDHDNQRCMPAYTVCNIAGYRVAFVGVLTTATELLEANVVYDHEGKRQCSFAKDSLVKVVQKTINQVRLGRPDWVILLTHMGIDPLSDHMTSWQLLEQLKGVDVVIDGHSHSVVNTTMLSAAPERETIVVAQTGSTLNNVGCLTLARGETPRVKLYACQNLPQSASVHETYGKVVSQMQPILGQVVGYTPFELCYNINGKRAVRSRETNLGDLVADAYRVQLGTDIGWVNGGGIRTGIEMGDVTYGQILSVSPFNNFMCVAQVTGRQLADALEEVYSRCPNELGSFAQLSGVKCVVDTNSHGAKRRVSSIMVMKEGKWQRLNSKALYTIASTDYVVFEGESKGLKCATILRDKVMTDTECLHRYIQKTLGGTIPETYRESQGRIQFK